MRTKVQEREMVLILRRKGLTYSQILKKVSVSKSSISIWLKDSPLTAGEKHLLKDKKEEGVSRGRIRAAASIRAARELRDKKTFLRAEAEFKKNVHNAFFQLGIGLYWAEGAKRTNCFGFINSDPEMINFMLVWIREFLIDSEDEIRMRVFTHKSFAHEKHETVWSKITGIHLERFGKTIYKTQGLQVKKRPNYSGCARIELGKVAHLRKLSYWQQMLIEHYKKAR